MKGSSGAQASSSAALAASITAAVAPWMPKATAGVPPLRKTITASPTGMMLAAAMKAPSRCGAARLASKMKIGGCEFRPFLN